MGGPFFLILREFSSLFSQFNEQKEDQFIIKARVKLENSRNTSLKK